MPRTKQDILKRLDELQNKFKDEHEISELTFDWYRKHLHTYMTETNLTFDYYIFPSANEKTKLIVEWDEGPFTCELTIRVEHNIFNLNKIYLGKLSITNGFDEYKGF